MGEGNTNRLGVIPWDLDYTWGLNWLGSRFDVNTIINNKLYRRLLELNPNEYKKRLVNRYYLLRASVLRMENIMPYFRNELASLTANAVEDFENERWNLEQHYSKEVDFIEWWLSERLVVLDAYFKNIVSSTIENDI